MNKRDRDINPTRWDPNAPKPKLSRGEETDGFLTVLAIAAVLFAIFWAIVTLEGWR